MSQEEQKSSKESVEKAKMEKESTAKESTAKTSTTQDKKSQKNTTKENMSPSNRYRTKPVTTKEKIQYFKDYYLVYVLIGIAVVIMVASLLNTMIFNRKETVVSVFVETAWGQIDTEQASDQLKEYLDITDKNQLTEVTQIVPADQQMQMVVTTRIAANDVDVIIADPEIMENYIEQGMVESAVSITEVSWIPTWPNGVELQAGIVVNSRRTEMAQKALDYFLE